MIQTKQIEINLIIPYIESDWLKKNNETTNYSIEGNKYKKHENEYLNFRIRRRIKM